MASANFIITTPTRLIGVLNLVLGRKISLPLNHFRFAANPTHATVTAMHFPANAGLIFLMDELTNDRYLVDTGATLSIVPCNRNSSPSGPLCKGQMGNKTPLGGSSKKLWNFTANFSHPFFCKLLWLVPIWALTF
jgi:hypothetical protein